LEIENCFYSGREIGHFAPYLDEKGVVTKDLQVEASLYFIYTQSWDRAKMGKNRKLSPLIVQHRSAPLLVEIFT